MDERFQISTTVEVHKDGSPAKAKMVEKTLLILINKQSKLTVMHEKTKSVLGEADLDLSEYVENENKQFKLTLKNCEDEEAYIEVGVKAEVEDDQSMISRRSSAKKKKQ